MSEIIANRDVIIVEDSFLAAKLLQEFLQKLGYKKIHVTRSGNEGLTTFKNFVDSELAPIVFLDYNLTDMDAPSVMTQIHEISPNVKIVLIGRVATKKDGSENIIAKEAHHLDKPIRLEKLRKVVNELENEDKMLTKKSTAGDKEIDKILKSSSSMSIARLSEFSNMKKDDVLRYLKDLEGKGKVKQLEDLKEVSCNKCGSVRTTTILYCPSCKSTKFRHSKLIEHYKCGNISPVDTYENDICPKCRKPIEALGVDYKLIVDFFVCNNCDNKFPNPSYDFLCLKCNNRFNVESAKWESSPAFKDATL